MDARQAMSRFERDYLRVVHELAERKAKESIAFLDIRERLRCTSEEADGACEFWVTRGVLEWSARGHVALTHLGLRQAEFLARNSWALAAS